MQKKQNKTKSTKGTERLAAFFFEVGTLRKIARAHRQTLLTDDLSDNIASHSFRVAHIGWHLAMLEKADAYKVLLMCLFHDTGEARSNDHNWVHKKYVKIFEDEIMKDQIGELPTSDFLLPILKEYVERKTVESKIAKDADLIDQILLLSEYTHAGNKEAPGWLADKLSQKYKAKAMFSKSAQGLVRAIGKQNPGDWWKNAWTNKNR